MRVKMLAVAVLCIAGVAMSGCARGMVRAKPLQDNIQPVLERHDKYVENDNDLSPTERRTYLRTTKLIRETLSEALREPPDRQVE